MWAYCCGTKENISWSKQLSAKNSPIRSGWLYRHSDRKVGREEFKSSRGGDASGAGSPFEEVWEERSERCSDEDSTWELKSHVHLWQSYKHGKSNNYSIRLEPLIPEMSYLRCEIPGLLFMASRKCFRGKTYSKVNVNRRQERWKFLVILWESRNSERILVPWEAKFW